jgi:ligand-binding SRPBCC domain-containing protein
MKHVLERQQLVHRPSKQVFTFFSDAANLEKSWHHDHTLDSVPADTRTHDPVKYEVPPGPLREIDPILFVARQVEGVFDLRRKIINETFGEAVR